MGKACSVKELKPLLTVASALPCTAHDVPMVLPWTVCPACGMETRRPRDAFVSPRYARLQIWPRAPSSYSSLRRQVRCRRCAPT